MHKLKTTGSILLVLFLLVACGGEEKQPTATSTTDSTATGKTEPPSEVVVLFERHCPGFTKYNESLSYKGAYPMYYASPSESGLPTDTEVLWLEYFISEDDTRIPGEFHANGYTLLAGIEKTTGAIVLKGIAGSVFLDDPGVSTSKDVVIPIK